MEICSEKSASPRVYNPHLFWVLFSLLVSYELRILTKDIVSCELRMSILLKACKKYVKNAL